MILPRTVKKNGTITFEYPTERFMDICWHRDSAGIIHHGEAIVLMALVNTRGRGRNTKDATDVRKIMRDGNLDD